MGNSETAYIEVYRARHAPEAHMIQTVLEEAGLQVIIEGEVLQAAGGELPTAWAAAPRVLVPSGQAAHARVVLQGNELRASGFAAAAGAKGDDPCLSCGAPMGPHEEQCRTCGWSFKESSDQSE